MGKLFIVVSILFISFILFGCPGTDEPTPDPTPNPGPDNLALNKPVVVSSVGNDTVGGDAVDGSRGTHWDCDGTGTQYIYIDLGQEYTINQVIIDWNIYGIATDYTIQVSNNASNWSVVHTETAGNGRIDDISLTGSGRYIRLNMMLAPSSFSYSINEIEVYETAGDFAPEPVPAGNIVYNGDFSEGLWQWNTWAHENATASFSADNGYLNCDITSGSDTNWHVAVNTFPVALHDITQYTVSFDAWADADRTINVEIQNFDDTWTVYDFLDLDITTGSVNYTVIFTMNNPDDLYSRLNFNLGASNTSVYIDNVVITEDAVPVPSPGTNMVSNGDFSDGTNDWGTYVQNGANVSISVNSGVLDIDIISPGGMPGDLHVGQWYPGACLIENNTYKLTLDSYADAERSMLLWISENNNDVNNDGWTWSFMFRNYIELKTAAFNSYAYYFTVPVGYTNLRAGTLFFCGEETPDIHIDNVSLVEVSQIPYTSWLTTSLAGGADAGSGVALGSLEHWYESDITTLGDSMWYSTSVSTSGTYEIFWNDFDDFNGYNDYAGDVVVSVYRTDGTTAYISSINRGYSTPIIVTPVQTTILIEVNAANASGGFAVGVHEQ